MKTQRIAKAVIWIMILFLGKSVRAEAGTIYDSPYVTFSPDGLAWTTDAGDQNVMWYAEDGSEDVYTGIDSALKAPSVGEHYYDIWRSGKIPVGQWKVCITRVNCCHNAYPEEDADYHGIVFERKPCLEPHFSGWRPICADCGRFALAGNLYMSREAAASISYLEGHDGISYYYLCPFNGNLEQGFELSGHTCKAVSANRYRVEYVANAGGDVYGGYMPASYHMYNNATEYEGREVTPQTRLNKNCYRRIGWEFLGWNTKADYSGQFYEDEAEILNLSTKDYRSDAALGSVKLYAVWRRSRSTLEIDPAGGAYWGDRGITTVLRDYKSVYEIDLEKVEAPLGHTVSFETNGGESIEAMTGTTHFTCWRQESPFLGEMKENKYVFSAPDGNTDRITAEYERDAVVLPMPVKPNESFGGWYYDEQFTKPAGGAGDRIVPTKDLILYAQWADLVLTAKDNYAVLQGRGAVDLSWRQQDGFRKTYKIYQREEGGENWRPVLTQTDGQTDQGTRVQYGYSGTEEFYTVPHTGFYNLTACGAQGGNYGNYLGGAGGEVAGNFWLEQGDVLKICVGGQNGYNGGGAGDRYACGGGCTSVYSTMQGLLMVAGGGGGAAPNGNGQEGGKSQSLVAAGMNGEGGASGGGGGFLGGMAGELIVHYHVPGVCNHLHAGSPVYGGGCYTTPVVCGESLEHEYTWSEYWHWGGSDENYCPNCGADASLGEECSGHEIEHYDHICPVHGIQESNTADDEPLYCEVVAGYAPGCGLTQEYRCGYLYDGYVISSKPAYGGSSYINEATARYYTKYAGTKTGNGSFWLEAEDVGYLQCHEMNGVPAVDKRAPEPVLADSVSKTAQTEDTVCITWEEPKDRGSAYYHIAESYISGSNQKLCVSNITENVLTSGIKGYYYCLDDHADTDVEARADHFLAEARIQVKLSENESYLHICAVDRADNLSESTHIPIGGRKYGDAQVAWQIFTQQIALRDSSNVYALADQKTYYVKCDGKTGFLLDYAAYMKGTATGQYQIGHAILEICERNGEEAVREVYVPNSEISEESITFDTESLSFLEDGESYLHSGDYVVVTRSDRNKRLSMLREFTLDKEADGMKMELVPSAGADHRGRMVCSDPALDSQNAVYIIGDGTAPEIYGLEDVEHLLVLDRREGEVTLRLSAEDLLSGLKEFYVDIRNLDNDAAKRYFPDENGRIQINITVDEPIFSGDFMVTAYACDNVGNEKTAEYTTTEFDLKVEIERILEPHEPVFQQGESGNLYITTWGYAERVEIEFPPELTKLDENLNHVYVYDLKQLYRQEETYLFMVPLYVPEAEQYTVTVRAYKGDKMLEKHPAFDVMGVQGTVLDEIRTRLR